jgi:Xaa-Pro aminopeptidase
MSPAPALPFADRIARLRNDLRVLNLDAFVITHLPNLRYVTGFAGTAGAAIVTPGRCTLVVDFRYVTAARDVLAALPQDLIDLHTVELTYDDALVDVLGLSGIPGRSGVARVGVEGASMTVNRFNRLAAALVKPDSGGGEESAMTRSVTLVPTDKTIEARRAVKDAFEIATLREAARRLSMVARAIPAFVQEGRSELAVAADIDSSIRAAGFERPAFDTIVAAGANSARPHARPGPRTLAAGDGVVLDFGGIYDGYCVDLTRTLHVGVPGPELRRLAGAVREAHAAAIAAVKPGARPSEIDAAARDVLARHGLAEAFGHGTGHGLGLEVHEDPRISKLPGALPDDPVVPGMVFTIEPGAYVGGLGGVRIEDDVLVVEGGCDVLTDVPIDF